MNVIALQSYTHQIIESKRVECDYIEYKESYLQKDKFYIRKYVNPKIKEMFFALHLIESYGSGIKRAKIALEKNNNDVQYFILTMIMIITQVIMNINKE